MKSKVSKQQKMYNRTVNSKTKIKSIQIFIFKMASIILGTLSCSFYRQAYSRQAQVFHCQSLIHAFGKWTAFIQRLYPKRCTIYASHSPIHTHIYTPTAIGCHARYQPARQEQLGVRCLAQGHFDTPRVGSNRQPSDSLTS